MSVVTPQTPDAGRRPEFEREPLDAAGIGEIERPLPLIERIVHDDTVQRVGILLALVLCWELYARWLDNALLFPTFTETMGVFGGDIASGVLPDRILTSLKSLAIGYAAGVALAGVFTTIAVASAIGTRLLSTLTAMFNPLPAIALLPLALIWFGLGNASLIFVLVHAVLWSVALNTHAGFRGVSETLRMVGRNYGLSGARYVTKILVPAALPGILTGLKIGWAFAWRTLIAAELVFGVSSGSGGLGWFIFENKNQLETASVFAGLLTVIMIGLAVENLVFRTVERATIHKWGMEH